MAGITLARAEAQLTLWLEADAATAGNQAFTIGTRSLTRADAGEIRENIKFWDSQCKSLTPGGGIRIFAGVPRD